MQPMQNVNAFLGAAVLGVITAAGLYIVEHYRQERRRHAMAKDLARLDYELSTVKRELQQLIKQKQERSARSKRVRISNKANSIISSSTVSEDYSSAVDNDSSDLEFYDVSDDEVDSSTNLDAILADIDNKLNHSEVHDLENCLEKLQDLRFEYPDNADVLWRIGKGCFKLADRSEDKETTKDLINQGIDACLLALTLNPDNSEVHKWYAMLVGARSDFQSIQGRISDGYLFKKHVDIALSLNATDATLHHMLGRFKYDVAGLKWYERKVAAALFSEPPNSTYSEALESFLEAENQEKDWKENRLFIAKCKIANGDYKEAVEWLNKACNIKQDDGLDDKVDLEIKTLLEEYNNYS